MTRQTNASILFVDDDINILLSLKRLVYDMNLEVHTAITAEEGLDILKKSHIDIVISDKSMPSMNGNEFLGKVAIEWPDTVRVMITAYTELTDVISAINAVKIEGILKNFWITKS
jgi:two-component system repressor protein LuxO